MGKLTLILILASLSFSTYGQNYFKGTIIDAKKEPIISASVILKDNTGSIITYNYTDELGKYSLKTEKTGQLVLIVSSIGFEQQSKENRIEKKNEIKTIDFILASKVTELKEIIIESKKPIPIKNDTIIFIGV